MSSLLRTSSWVIVRLSDGAPYLETYNPDIVKALNTEKFKAVPILQWLQSLNQRPKH